MKKSNSLLALAALTVLLIAGTTLRAGPPPDLSNRMRPMISDSAKAEAAAKADANKIPALCAHMQNCGCAAMSAKNAKS